VLFATREKLKQPLAGLFLVISLLAYAKPAQPAGMVMEDGPPRMRPSPRLIIKQFIAAEGQMREKLQQFSFKRAVVLQTIGRNGEVTGEYLRDSVFVLDDNGNRIEQVLYHPKSSIKAMTITKEDIQDLAGSQLLGFESQDLNRYQLTYRGEEVIDGRQTYKLFASPRQKPDPHHMKDRFFVGDIWVDQDTFQVIQLRGITEPHGKQRFPTFQTTRETRIEDQFFPTSTTADDVLHFPHKDVHCRLSVRYHEFKRFTGKLTIRDQDP
jgi:hypothetical protein